MTGAVAAGAARDAFREQVEAKGHAVENVRTAVGRLEQAIDRGDIRLTPEIGQMLEDLRVALEQDDDQKLGGKSAEAARFIARALMRELDQQAAGGYERPDTRRGRPADTRQHARPVHHAAPPGLSCRAIVWRPPAGIPTRGPVPRAARRGADRVARPDTCRRADSRGPLVRSAGRSCC